jgi:hypothetical protein
LRQASSIDANLRGKHVASFVADEYLVPWMVNRKLSELAPAKVVTGYKTGKIRNTLTGSTVTRS